ncbi:SRPBCC family protein [Leucothrix sargassi]|nr:SRPBCC family protein [Leucothrix sargassi]
MNISVNIEIERPLETVWKAVCNIKKADKMISAITRLKILEEPDEEGSLVGLKWRETRKVFGKESDETMWIIDYQELSSYTTRAENHGAIYTSTISVKEVGENTLLTMAFSGTSNSRWTRFVAAVMSIFVKRSMIKMLDKDLLEIKEYIEKKGEITRRN